MKKLLVVFGTRPEAIKMAPVIRALNAESRICSVEICVTAQHRQMLDQVLDIFEIKPTYDLDIMRDNQDLFGITVRALGGLKEVIQSSRPDVILVQGDTTTTMAAAMAAFYSDIPVGHVEAGLRSHRLDSPYPEEMNRQVTSRMAAYHFAPTSANKENLEKEGIREEDIYITGNTVVDALLYMNQLIVNDHSRQERIENYFYEVCHHHLGQRPYILVTGHRRENFGQRLENICMALQDISVSRPDLDIIFPVHMNPIVRETASRVLSNCSNVFLIEPVGYEHFVYLMARAHLILTDSGGIQEEGPSLGKPVLVMRDTTERWEGIHAGTVKLVGVNRRDIVDATLGLLDDQGNYEAMSRAVNPYGDGRASERIANILLKGNDLEV